MDALKMRDIEDLWNKFKVVNKNKKSKLAHIMIDVKNYTKLSYDELINIFDISPEGDFNFIEYQNTIPINYKYYIKIVLDDYERIKMLMPMLDMNKLINCFKLTYEDRWGDIILNNFLDHIFILVYTNPNIIGEEWYMDMCVNTTLEDEIKKMGDDMYRNIVEEINILIELKKISSYNLKFNIFEDMDVDYLKLFLAQLRMVKRAGKGYLKKEK